MKITSKDHVFNEAEIEQILRESEGRSVGDRRPGHTIARHDLFSPFSHRTNIYLKDLRGRFLEEGEEYTKTSGAFQNGLVPALRFALTRHAGREAIGVLLRPENIGVKLRANIESGNFRIVYYKRKEGILTADRTGFAPLSENADFWIPRTGTAQGIFVFLLKTTDGHIHIQTAFPIAVFSEPSSCVPISAD